VARGATENHLAQAALRVGALDQEIRSHRSRFRQNGFARTGAHACNGFIRCLYAIGLQVGHRILHRRTGRDGTLHRDQSDALGAPQDRHREQDAARSLRAGVPVNEHSLAERRARNGRGHQHRMAAVEQGGFERRHARAQRIVLYGRPAAPAEARGFIPCCRMRRRVGIKSLAYGAAEFGLVPVCRGNGHGDDGIGRHDLREGGA
jgi:hypothetical protein